MGLSRADYENQDLMGWTGYWRFDQSATGVLSNAALGFGLCLPLSCQWIVLAKKSDKYFSELNTPMLNNYVTECAGVIGPKMRGNQDKALEWMKNQSVHPIGRTQKNISLHMLKAVTVAFSNAHLLFVIKEDDQQNDRGIEGHAIALQLGTSENGAGLLSVDSVVFDPNYGEFTFPTTEKAIDFVMLLLGCDTYKKFNRFNFINFN